MSALKRYVIHMYISSLVPSSLLYRNSWWILNRRQKGFVVYKFFTTLRV